MEQLDITTSISFKQHRKIPRGISGGRKSGWIGAEKNDAVKAVRLPLPIFNALINAKKILSIQSIASKLSGGSCTTTDDDGLEYDSILPVELAELKRKLAKLETDKTKLANHCNQLLDKLEVVATTPQQSDSELEKLQSIIDSQELKINELAKSNKELGESNLELRELLDEEQADNKLTVDALKADIVQLETSLSDLQSKQAEPKQSYGITIEGVTIKPEVVQTALVEWNDKVESGKGPRWKNMKTFWSILKGVGK